MSDLVKRARRLCSHTDFNGEHCKQRKNNKTFWCLHCLQADEIERLKAELFTMRNVFHQQDAEIERLTEIKDLAIKDSMAEAKENEQLHAEIEQLKGDLQVTRLQRDARMVSEFVVDDAVKAEIERLQTEASCNYCGKYHGREVCESLVAEIKELERELDMYNWRAADEIERLTVELDQTYGDIASIRDDKDAVIERLKAVVDAAKAYVWSLEHGKTAEAMNCYLQALHEALEDSSDE